jgi:hypothetical protein
MIGSILIGLSVLYFLLGLRGLDQQEPLPAVFGALADAAIPLLVGFFLRVKYR